MRLRPNRKTTYSTRAMIVLGAIGATAVLLAIFSDPLHPIITAAPPSAPIGHQNPVVLEGVSFAENPPGYDPDLDVDFSDGHFGSDIPADNGAAWYLRRFRVNDKWPKALKTIDTE